MHHAVVGLNIIKGMIDNLKQQKHQQNNGKLKAQPNALAAEPMNEDIYQNHPNSFKQKSQTNLGMTRKYNHTDDKYHASESVEEDVDYGEEEGGSLADDGVDRTADGGYTVYYGVSAIESGMLGGQVFSGFFKY